MLRDQLERKRMFNEGLTPAADQGVPSRQLPGDQRKCGQKKSR
jgi:hypothetical protein